MAPRNLAQYQEFVLHLRDLTIQKPAVSSVQDQITTVAHLHKVSFIQ